MFVGSDGQGKNIGQSKTGLEDQDFFWATSASKKGMRAVHTTPNKHYYLDRDLNRHSDFIVFWGVWTK